MSRNGTVFGKILALLKEHGTLTPMELAELGAISYHTVRSQLTLLKKFGKVVNIERGLWSLKRSRKRSQ